MTLLNLMQKCANEGGFTGCKDCSYYEKPEKCLDYLKNIIAEPCLLCKEDIYDKNEYNLHKDYCQSCGRALYLE